MNGVRKNSSRECPKLDCNEFLPILHQTTVKTDGTCETGRQLRFCPFHIKLHCPNCLVFEQWYCEGVQLWITQLVS
ncbi:hypothetical protein Sjap_026026 [Stephania japonica]|uniref:Uncharacterized protein n=1 Tax=Stephania japonica TaxID=461633 RepID=A0AAP0E2Q8_9MAGN